MIHRPIREMQRTLLAGTIFWSVIIALSFSWGLYQISDSFKKLALNQAVQSLDKDQLYRRWATMHGGVYVATTDRTPSNPYLKGIPEQDITTPSGRGLTLVNPAYMNRQVFELGKERYGNHEHITSLKPLRPENGPDDWERSALLTFQEKNLQEVSSTELLEGKPHLRYMRALITEEGCLKCHRVQGYSTGDVRGGISVSIPLAPFLVQEQQQMRSLALRHGIVWLVGICFIQVGRRKLSASLLREEATQKELESSHARLLQQEKMASIGQLAAGVAHEINNPMGFITSNLGTLEKYMGKIREYLGIVEEGGDTASARSRLKIDFVLSDSGNLISESLGGAIRVKNIVTDLKNLSYGDRQELVRADVNRCLESALNIAGSELGHVGEINQQLGDIPEIFCHPQQLGQVFINLLSNAGQAIKDHGTITLRSWYQDGSVFVSVADSGCGIPEENRPRIFEPFFTTRDVGAGTGLGLSICYDIVHKHGGEITVESIVGTGSTFVVRLPVGTGG